MPDHIFVPGKEIAKIFQKQKFKSTSIKVTGSPKKKNQNFIFKTRQNLRVLILPEGFESETLKLINFGIDEATNPRLISERRWKKQVPDHLIETGVTPVMKSNE